MTEHLGSLSLKDLVEYLGLPGPHPNVERELLSLNNPNAPRFQKEELLAYYRHLRPSIARDNFGEFLKKHKIMSGESVSS